MPNITSANPLLRLVRRARQTRDNVSLILHIAKQSNIKRARGTATLFDAKLAARQGAPLAKMTRWFTPTQVLKMATADNAAARSSAKFRG
jgi:hypothetical protein